MNAESTAVEFLNLKDDGVRAVLTPSPDRDALEIDRSGTIAQMVETLVEGVLLIKRVEKLPDVLEKVRAEREQIYGSGHYLEAPAEHSCCRLPAVRLDQLTI